MQLILEENYKKISSEAANDLVEILQTVETPLLCIASGDSPKGLYKELSALKKSTPAMSNWNYVGLDEWVGMDETTEGSCSFHLMNDLVSPLEISNEKICFFNGKAKDLQQECNRIENFIHRHQGIDAAIVGLGLNGHIAMNEPGTPAILRTHVSVIAKETQQTGQKYFNHPQQLTHGITIGLATLMEAKNIFLIVSETKKAGIVKQMLTAEISEQLPCTLIRNHPGLRIYLDAEAAALIPNDMK